MTVDVESRFAHRVVEDGILIAQPELLQPLGLEGLDRLGAWQDQIRQFERVRSGPGRGATTVLTVPGIGPIRLKQLRRGGLLAPCWRDRFAGTARLLANLEIPAEARSRGVSTPEAVALFLAPGPTGFYRGWLAVREVSDSTDLWTLLDQAMALDAPSIEACAEVVRGMHDAGLRHPDLNIGNLLVRSGKSAPEAFVIDLDKASIQKAPLSIALRESAIERLERSYVKHLQPQAARLVEFRKIFRRAYSANDPKLVDRLL